MSRPFRVPARTRHPPREHSAYRRMCGHRPHDFAQNRTSGIGKITAAVGRVGFARYGRKCFCAVVRSFRSSLQVFRSDGLRDEIAVDGFDARHPLSVVVQGADGCAAGRWYAPYAPRSVPTETSRQKQTVPVHVNRPRRLPDRAWIRHAVRRRTSPFRRGSLFYLTGGHTPTRQDGLFSSTLPTGPK